MSVTDPVATRRRGRPRSTDADEAIVAATVELAREVGINGLSMDVLAARAGVSKTTIYRRWSSKEALVLHALSTTMRPFDDVDTGSLRGDLDLYLGELVRRFEPSPMNDVLPHLIEAACLDKAIRSSLDEYVQFRRVPLSIMLERAQSRGELSKNTDVGLLIDAITGPFIYRRLLSRERIDGLFVQRLLALLLPSIYGSES